MTFLEVFYVLTIITALVFMFHSIIHRKEFHWSIFLLRLLLGVIGVSFGAIVLLCSPSSRNCLVIYSLLVFLFFGVSLVMFLMGDNK